MKVRSWLELILILMLGGVMIGLGFKGMADSDLKGIYFIALAIGMLMRYVPDVIFEERHEENQRIAYTTQWIASQAFGCWAHIMPWIGLLLFDTGWIAGAVCPDDTDTARDCRTAPRRGSGVCRVVWNAAKTAARSHG